MGYWDFNQLVNVSSGDIIQTTCGVCAWDHKTEDSKEARQNFSHCLACVMHAMAKKLGFESGRQKNHQGGGCPNRGVWLHGGRRLQKNALQALKLFALKGLWTVRYSWTAVQG